MLTKKLSIHFAASSLDFLDLLTASDDAENVGISSATNLSIQTCALIAIQTKIPLKTNELLYCCDILNGGAHLTEFMPPDAVNIEQSLYSMMFSLRDGLNYAPSSVEQWDVTDGIVDKLNTMTIAEKFALAVATRQFWSGTDLGDIKSLKSCDGYSEWASQWVALK